MKSVDAVVLATSAVVVVVAAATGVESDAAGIDGGAVDSLAISPGTVDVGLGVETAPAEIAADNAAGLPVRTGIVSGGTFLDSMGGDSDLARLGGAF